MSIALITFDLDDTLWDVLPVLRRAENAQWQWLQTHRPAALAGLGDGDLRELKKHVWREHKALAHDVGALRRALLNALQHRGGYAEDAIAEGTREAFGVFLAERQRVELYPTALPALRQLAKRYRLIALSNGNADIFATPAGSCFSAAFNAAQVGASKPHPALFKAACNDSGIPAAATVHVGDHPQHDVAGAAALGMRTVWFNNRARKWLDVAADQAPADTEVRCLSELPEALEALAARSN